MRLLPITGGRRIFSFDTTLVAVSSPIWRPGPKCPFGRVGLPHRKNVRIWGVILLQSRILEVARAYSTEVLAAVWGVSPWGVHDRMDGFLDLSLRDVAAIAILSGRPLSEFATP